MDDVPGVWVNMSVGSSGELNDVAWPTGTWSVLDGSEIKEITVRQVTVGTDY